MPEPKINTLVSDIYDVFEKDVEVTPEDATNFGGNLARIIVEKIRPQSRNYLRLSNVGESCLRRLWYSCNAPELGEKLSGPTRIKFLIGDITEAVILFLARLAGHSVKNEQQEVNLHGVKGHIDADVDDILVDVKSASTPNFKKFKNHLTPETDAFGYLSQIGGYAKAKGKTKAAFLAVDKVLGHLHLDEHDLPDVDYETKINHIRSVLDSNELPDRGFGDEKFGESGNRALGLKCGYCEFKHACWPGLREIQYAKGPVFFTKVVREPNPRTKGE